MKRRGMFWVVAICVSMVFTFGMAYAEKPPIKIGAMFISSGKVGGYGKHGRQAIELAVDEINASGGILGRTLEATVEDTQLKKDRVISLAEKFIREDKVDFLMGPRRAVLPWP